MCTYRDKHTNIGISGMTHAFDVSGFKTHPHIQVLISRAKLLLCIRGCISEMGASGCTLFRWNRKRAAERGGVHV